MALLYVLLSTLGIYASVILLTRLGGLRSFSKMSGFDFAVTVAIGSLIAMVLATKDPPLVQGIVALAALYATQAGIAILRRRSTWVSRLVNNEPLLLMDGAEVLQENMDKASMTKADLRAKLREANVLSLDEIRAVVMETTGDVSVLHGPPDGRELDGDLLDGVRGSR